MAATLNINVKNVGDFYMVPSIPPGLTTVIEGLTREIIRHHPKDIYMFAARHFEKLLDIREEYENQRESAQVPDKRFQTLQEIAEITERRQQLKKLISSADDALQRSGWSLNETAKVLERYRYAFNGSNGNTHTVDQTMDENAEYLNHLAKYSLTTSSTTENVDEIKRTDKYVERTTKTSHVRADTMKDTRKEFHSSRARTKERKGVSSKYENEFQDSEFSKKTSKKKSSERTKKSQTDHSKRRAKSIYDEHESMESENAKDGREEKLFESSARKSSSRALSSEKANSYISHSLSSTSVLEELQSASYVEKVHKATDETTEVIKKNVEVLKNGLFKVNGKHATTSDKREKKSSKSSNSLDSSRQSTQDSESEHANNISKHSSENKRHEKSVTSLGNSLDGVNSVLSKSAASRQKNFDVFETKLKETQCLMEKISTKFSKTMRRSVSAKDLHRVGHFSEFVVTETLENNNCQNPLKSSLPSVRPSSSRNASRAYMQNNGTDDLVLPHISSKVPRTVKTAENLVLPVLSPPSTSSVNSKSSPSLHGNEFINSPRQEDEKATPTKTTDEIASKKQDESEMVNNQQNRQLSIETDEQLFKDSLNVTPEPLNTSQRPDSLESEDHLREENAQETNAVNANLKDKLMEIETVGKTIETLLSVDNLQATKTSDNIEDVGTTDNTRITQEDLLLKETILPKEDEKINHDSKSSGSSEQRDTVISKTDKGIANIIDCPLKINETILENISQETRDAKDDEDNTNVRSLNESSNPSGKDELLQALEEENRFDGNSPSARNPESNFVSYVLTEGSPCEIPDSVTTVIIPDRSPTPDLDDTIDIELGKGLNDQAIICEPSDSPRPFIKNSEIINNAFGEVVSLEGVEFSEDDTSIIHDIKIGHDIMFRQDLDRIKEEEEEEEKSSDADKTDDEQIYKIVTKSLENILEKEEVDETHESLDKKNVSKEERLAQEGEVEKIVKDIDTKIDEQNISLHEMRNVTEEEKLLQIGEEKDVVTIDTTEEDVENIDTREKDVESINIKEDVVGNIDTKEKDVENIDTKEKDVVGNIDIKETDVLEYIDTKGKDVENVDAKEKDVENVDAKEKDVVENIDPKEKDISSSLEVKKEITESSAIDNDVQNGTHVESNSNICAESVSLDETGTNSGSDSTVTNTVSPDPMMPFVPELNLKSLEDVADSTDQKTSDESISDSKMKEESLDEVENLSNESIDTKLADTPKLKESSVQDEEVSLVEEHVERKEHLKDDIIKDIIDKNTENDTEISAVKEICVEKEVSEKENSELRETLEKTEDTSKPEKEESYDYSSNDKILHDSHSGQIMQNVSETINIVSKSDSEVSSQPLTVAGEPNVAETEIIRCEYEHEKNEHNEEITETIINECADQFVNKMHSPFETETQDINKETENVTSIINQESLQTEKKCQDENNISSKIAHEITTEEENHEEKKSMFVEKVTESHEKMECVSLEETECDTTATQVEAESSDRPNNTYTEKLCNADSTTDSATAIVEQSMTEYSTPRRGSFLSTEKMLHACIIIQRNYRKYKAKKEAQKNAHDSRNNVPSSSNILKEEHVLQHTGEFHDCIPLPISNVNLPKYVNLNTNVESKEETITDLVPCNKDESILQNRYLNFITSIEDSVDVTLDLIQHDNPNSHYSNNDSDEKEPLAISIDTPRGVIIEEIKSIEESNISTE